MVALQPSLAQQLADQKRINAALQNEVHWLYATIYNPSFNETDIRLMSELTPWGVKAGILSPDEADEKKVYYPALAKTAHCSAKVASEHVRTLTNKAGAFSYRREHSHDEETEQDITRVSLAPRAPTATPEQIDLARAKRGGSTWKDGKRLKRCPACESPVIHRRSQYWCQNPDCLHTWEDERWQPVNNTDDIQAEEEQEANRHNDTLQEEEESEPEGDPEPEKANSHIDVLPEGEQDTPPIPTTPVSRHKDGSFGNFVDPPEFLRRKQIWCCGRLVWNEEQERFDKVPFIADMRGTAKASSTNPQTWRSYDVARAVLEKSQSWTGTYAPPFDFLMFMCDGTFTFLDQDHCRNQETGKYEPEAIERARKINSYTEKSWSDDGLHTYAIATLPPGRRRRDDIGVEMYDQARPCVYTGKPLPGFPLDIERRQNEIAMLHAEVFPPQPEMTWQIPADDGDHPRTDEEMEQMLAEVLPKATSARNGAKFLKLWNGDASDYRHKNGMPDHSRADAALCKMLAHWAGRCVSTVDWLYRRSKLYRPKWERSDYRERTLRYAFSEGAMS
jgi:NrS-1  polymerase HBD domain